MLAISLEQLPLVVAVQHERQRAALLEGYAAAAMRRAGLERMYTETTIFERLRVELAASLAPDDVTDSLPRAPASPPKLPSTRARRADHLTVR
jgi:hypothetical protein